MASVSEDKKPIQERLFTISFQWLTQVTKEQHGDVDWSAMYTKKSHKNCIIKEN